MANEDNTISQRDSSLDSGSPIDGNSDKLTKGKAAGNTGTFGSALQVWTEIDLPTVQKTLDEQALALKDEQKGTLVSRKELAARTKDFKKLANEDKLEQLKPLLKQYQNEIDSLTNKKKTVEGHFFTLYRLLAEAPDPRPLLEASLHSVMELAEIDTLRSEVIQLKDELSKKADYDQLKQRLLRNEQKSAELLSSKLKAKDEEYKALIDEKTSNWQEQEKEFERQIQDTRNKMEELRTSKEVTELQLSTHNKQLGTSNTDASASVLTQLNIVTRDAESYKKRVFELEKRNEALRRELSISQSDAERQNLKEEFKTKISELEGENALLGASLDKYRNEIESLNKSNSIKVDSLNRDVTQLVLEIKNLKGKLQSMGDYDELKHEVQLLRQIEFSVDDENDSGNDVISDSKKEIDSLLVKKNKALTKELSDLRSQHDALVAKIEELEANCAASNQEVEIAKRKNDKLERDLADLQNATFSSRATDNISMISGITKMTSGNQRNGSIAGLSLASSGEDNSILSIITKQRDRFRDRNTELEDEIKKQHTITNNLKRDINSLKRDNEELYERTRYLASFKQNNDKTTTSAGARSLNVSILRPKPNSSIDLESNTYQQNYESKLHPIEQFRLREQERINSKLSPIERLFISLTRTILATRTTRMLFALYCVCLHGMVMLITIYAMNLSTRMIPEVGINDSTGGIASG